MSSSINFAESVPITHSLIKQCLNVSRTVAQFKQTHALILKTTSQKDNHLLAYLLVKLLRVPSDNLVYVRYLFDEIPRRPHFLWTSLIHYYVWHGHYATSISLFAESHRAGIPPSGFVFSAVLNACARMFAMLEGRQVHAWALQVGCLGNKIVQTTLLDMYAKCGNVCCARNVFDGIEGRDVVTWTAMIRGYAKLGMMADASILFDKMEGGNAFCWTTMVAGYANIGNMDSARELYDKMEVKDEITWISMISGYGKLGDVIRARGVFDEATVKGAVCWAAMLSCYAQNGYAMEALEVYKEMKNLGVTVSEVAMVAAISACTQLVDVKMANKLDKHVEDGCCRRTVVVSNALIHMHSRCGNIDRALQEFDRMKTRDVISYGALITGLADHGKTLEALDLFHKMLAEDITPNQVTFVSILGACSHAGLVEEGLSYFNMMTKVFGIKPLIEHYSSIIDLLGRAGELEKAYNILVNSSHGACDAGVWGALLGACRVHGNAELGEIVASKLFMIEPRNPGNYMLLASIYASADRWADAEKVRKLMLMRGMAKSPGSSLHVNE